MAQANDRVSLGMYGLAKELRQLAKFLSVDVAGCLEKASCASACIPDSNLLSAPSVATRDFLAIVTV